MSEAIIRVEGLHKSFRFGQTRVLNGLDLQVPEGAVVGLLGTNGSGKSTLLKCILGLLKPQSGRSTVMGDDSWDMTGRTKSRLGYVPQVVKLYGWMMVGQIIDYVGSFYERWDRGLAAQLRTMWELDENKFVGTLSTGQLQRVGLILAMGHRPDLLVLDEPAASLDPAGRRSLLRSLLEITADQKHTVLFSTHITSDLERVASHVAIMKRGKIDYFGELDELKDSVKRVRVLADSPLPDTFTVPQAIRTQVDGSRAVASVLHVDPAAIDELEAKWHARITIEDLNLEDIFLELHDE